MKFSTVLLTTLAFVLNALAQDSLNITMLSRFDSNGGELVKVDDYLYLANQGEGIGILDVSDPTNPVQYEGFPIPTLTNGVAISDNYIYLACMDSGLYVLDVTNRTELQEICRIATQDVAFDVSVRDSILFFADYRAGLRVFDVSDMQEIEEIGHYNPGLVAAFITLVEDFAFVSTMFANLRTVNVSDPTNPYQLSMIQSSSAFRVAGNFPMIYVADGSSGVRLIDLTEPASPNQVSVFDTPGFSTDVALMNDLVVIADGRTGGLRVVDFSDPFNPVTLGYYVTNWAVEELLIGEDGIIYTSGGVFRFTRPGSVEDDRIAGPLSFSISTAFPNPFNTSTSFSFTLYHRTLVNLSVIDASGRVVEELLTNRVSAPGRYSANWNAFSQPTGTYYIRIQSADKQMLQPATLIR